MFAESNGYNPDLVGVLFVMTIDPARSTTPFASIIDVSSFGSQEDEVLFSMHTVFRIGTITRMGENHRLFQVELTLTDDNDKDFRELTDRIREETFPDSTGWYRLGLVLLKMGQPEKAQRVYEILLEQETEERAKAPIYINLGVSKMILGNMKRQLDSMKNHLQFNNNHFLQSVECIILIWLLPINNIGEVYQNMGDYPKALSSYEKALAIRQQSLPPNHPHLAMSYNNIGSVYEIMGDYPKALSSHEKALAIRQQYFPLIILIWLLLDNIGECMKTWVTIEKALSQFDNNHFLPIILIWLLPTTTSV